MDTKMPIIRGWHGSSPATGIDAVELRSEYAAN
jgi:hypothetical protein